MLHTAGNSERLQALTVSGLTWTFPSTLTWASSAPSLPPSSVSPSPTGWCSAPPPSGGSGPAAPGPVRWVQTCCLPLKEGEGRQRAAMCVNNDGGRGGGAPCHQAATISHSPKAQRRPYAAVMWPPPGLSGGGSGRTSSLIPRRPGPCARPVVVTESRCCSRW